MDMKLEIITFQDSGTSWTLYESGVISASHNPGKIDCKIAKKKL